MRTRISRLLFCAVFTLLLALAAAGCSLPVIRPDLSTPTSMPITVEHGSISGRLWHDVCVNDEPGAVSEDCVESAGAYRADGDLDDGEEGIQGAVVKLGKGACPAGGYSTAETDEQGAYSFDQLPPGVYCVSVDRSSSFPSLNEPGIWTHPLDASNEGTGSHTVVVEEGQNRDEVNFGWDYLLRPGGQPAAPVETQQPVASPEPVCLNSAVFVSDVSLPDGTTVAPASELTKTWRIRNTGTCTWDSGYDLVFVSGSSMGSPGVISLGRTVEPGETVDIGVKLSVPEQEGLFTGHWKLRSSDNDVFGFGEEGDASIWASVVVKDEPPEDVWRGTYYNSTDLAGSPALIREDERIRFDWGSDSPAAGVQANRFSVRWERLMELPESEYRIRVVADDGVRLYVDNQLVIDEWEKGAAREFTVALWLDQGEHEFMLEYFEFDGKAKVEFRINNRDSIHVAGWKGTYWPDRSLEGDLAVVQDDSDLAFDWDDGAAVEGFPVDNFSASWEGHVDFEDGLYTFYARADDGIRIWVDGTRIINEWSTSDGSRLYRAEKALSGQHTIRVAYFEKTGNANIRVWWEKQEVVNSAPQAQADAWTLSEDIALQVSGSGVLANDSDPEGAVLTALLQSDVQHGILALSSDGSFLYTPEADFHGEDSFTYTTSDGVLNSSAVAVTLTVQSVNDVPQAAGESVEVWSGQVVDIDVLSNDTGLGDTPLTITAVESSRGVTPDVSGNVIQYSAPSGESGSDSFTYEVRDADGETASAVVTIVILDPGG